MTAAAATTATSPAGWISSGATTKRSNSEKGPRMRTVLSEQQLQTLRTVYTTNQRPDALMKEHLVEITRLSDTAVIFCTIIALFLCCHVVILCCNKQPNLFNNVFVIRWNVFHFCWLEFTYTMVCGPEASDSCTAVVADLQVH